MVHIPHESILLQGVPVPEKGRYGTGIVFMPKHNHSQEVILDIIVPLLSKTTLTISIYF